MTSSSFETRKFKNLLLEPVRNGIYKTKEFHGRGCKIINMGELFGYPRMFDVPMKRVELSEKELVKSLVQNGDLLFARRSLTAAGAGKCSIIKAVNEPTTFESSIIRARPDPKIASSDYLYYYFLSPVGREQVGTILRQVAVSGITGSDLMELNISLPSKESQVSIASILSSLDDRIALLRETNATLEAIAQALFKSWFVDFEPVHAKQQGQMPEGMDEATAALFPDSLEESELGLVPKGWRVGSIGHIASVRGGFAYKSSDFSDKGLPVLKIKNIVGDGTIDGNDVQRISPAIAEKTTRFGLKDGDVLMAMTGATIGKVGIVVALNNEVPYLNQRVAKFEEGKETGNNSWLIFTAFQNTFMSDQIVNAASGSAQPNISTTGIESARLTIPDDLKVLKAFDSIVTPLFSVWVNNQKQGKTLAALRDTLLPRLISGQLRITEDEEAVEEVAA